MKELRNGKWNHQVATNEEVNEAIDQIKALVSEYHWEDKKIYMYSRSTNIMDWLEGDGLKNFNQYKFSSKQIIISEINVVIDSINIWESKELEEKVTVRFIIGKRNGEVVELPKSTADELVELEMVEII